MATAGDPGDVVRSLRRYVAQTLGSPPWKVRTQRSRVADDERPVAVVEDASPLTTPFARTSRVQGDQQKAQTFAIVCYPLLEAKAAESRMEAQRVASLLDAAITRGLVTDDDPPQLIGGPFHIPLYDFSQTPVSGQGRAGPADPYFQAVVERGYNVRTVQDPLDELRYTVVVTLPLTWWQGGSVALPAPIAASMPGTFQPSG